MKKICTRFCSLLLVILAFSNPASSFAQGITQIADRLEIAEVIAKYSYTNDYPDAEAYAALYTEDAIWEAYVLDETEPFLRVESRAAILAGAQNREPNGIKGGHHQSGLLFLELTPTTARTQIMVLLSRQEADETIPRIVSAGTYYDTFRKTADGWKFKTRILRIDGPIQ